MPLRLAPQDPRIVHVNPPRSCSSYIHLISSLQRFRNDQMNLLRLHILLVAAATSICLTCSIFALVDRWNRIWLYFVANYTLVVITWKQSDTYNGTKHH
ncbi:hypothetical protein V1515DRAFT_590704 [Lipomyces mesembrius]